MLKVTGATLGAKALWTVLAAGMGPVVSAQAPDTIAAAQAVVEGTCRRCHNDRARYGNMSLDGFEVATADERPALAERMGPASCGPA